eukprot:TRINITY_DN69525_c0_g1_i1.p1 TRINITY_DN69525_c0_g1~~TRINITY_DN69525_c0_g1_i1.p1  ORF type:complete len:142 (+),score=18.21 TRINITY_DN69525_c0_g1_i1:94-519(+)
MSKAKKKYEAVQYQPPTPQVFGAAAPADLPVSPAPVVTSFNVVDKPRNRPKLQDRLAVYEDDSPRCQRMIFYLGFCIFPLWWIGSVMYCRTPTTKVMTREAGFRNVVMALLSVFTLLLAAFYHLYIQKMTGGGFVGFLSRG